MPIIARFFGILVKMFFNEHNPPHFHAFDGEFEGLIDIERNELIGGSLAPRVLGLVTEWTEIHKVELLNNWYRAMNQERLYPIDPLV